ncbi:MAG: type II secretion system F family protein [Burkholderiales bacterium]|nr:type II secretion system F family protein [Burkholderiales bacterium]
MRFKLKAMRPAEGIVTLSLDAPSQEEALQLATSQGYAVLSVRAQRLPTLFAAKGPRGSRFPLPLFSAELLALLKAGLSLVEALQALAEKEQQAEARRIIEGVVQRLYEGLSFSQALEGFPRVFPPLYVATLRAAERTGNLQEALARYIGYQAQLDLVRKKLLSAAIYPTLLIVVGGLVTLFLLGYVVPRFSQVYDDLATDLPLLSRWLIAWGRFLEGHAWQAVTAAVVLGGLTVYGLSHPATRRWLGLQLWQVPAVGERLRVFQLARFYRTLGMLLNGGIPIVTALAMVEGLLHPTLRSLMCKAREDIRTGRPISGAMETHGLTTPVALRLLRVGERSGRMGEMMERIATFHDEETARWVDWFTRLFEPLLMMVIGLVIGLIVVLLYLPIFELAGSLR